LAFGTKFEDDIVILITEEW